MNCLLQEHDFFSAEWNDKYQSKTLIKWDKPPQGGWGYYAYYCIGAEWLAQDKAIVVTTKKDLESIDWAAMFMTCFEAADEADNFGGIYNVDFEQPPIKAPILQSVLTPLLLVHFLQSVKNIVQKGLKRDYVQRSENLPKVKGRIGFLQNLRRNIVNGRADRVFCRYSELSVDIPENRLIRRALEFSQSMLMQMQQQGHNIANVQTTFNQCLVAFSGVKSEIEFYQMRQTKSHKLYKEYNIATRLARMILQRYDFALSKANSVEQHTVPVFWVNMSLLYEHYVLGLLRRAYGKDILYQSKGHSGLPDFLHIRQQVILDTKYKPRYDDSILSNDDIRQLAGYARDKKIRERIGIELTDETTVVPCVIIYPKEKEEDKPLAEFHGNLFDIAKKDKDFVEFYRICVDLPTCPSRRQRNIFVTPKSS